MIQHDADSVSLQSAIVWGFTIRIVMPFNELNADPDTDLKGSTMGLFSALTGNASEVSTEKMESLFTELLAPGEQIEKAYQLVRDMIVFTNKRMMLVDKQGVTGHKAEVVSIPYSKITKFSKESAGLFDLDAELKIWVGSDPDPIKQQFSRMVNINEVYSVLSAHVLA